MTAFGEYRVERAAPEPQIELTALPSGILGDVVGREAEPGEGGGEPGVGPSPMPEQPPFVPAERLHILSHDFTSVAKGAVGIFRTEHAPKAGMSH
jgi:hypothetical protein